MAQCKIRTWFDSSKTWNKTFNSYCYFIIAEYFPLTFVKFKAPSAPSTPQKRGKGPDIHQCCLRSHRTDEIPELLYLTISLVVVAVQLGDHNNRITPGSFHNHLTKTVIRSKWKSRGLLSQWKNKVSKYTEKTSRPLSSRRNTGNRGKKSFNLLTFFWEVATVDWDFCFAQVQTGFATRSLTPHKNTLHLNNSLYWNKEITNLPKRYLFKLTHKHRFWSTDIVVQW